MRWDHDILEILKQLAPLQTSQGWLGSRAQYRSPHAYNSNPPSVPFPARWDRRVRLVFTSPKQSSAFFFETSSKSLDRLISIQFQFNPHFVFWQTYQHISSKNQYFNNRFNMIWLFTIYQPWQTNTFLVQPDLVPAMIYTYHWIYFYNTKTAYIYIFTLWLLV